MQISLNQTKHAQQENTLPYITMTRAEAIRLEDFTQDQQFSQFAQLPVSVIKQLEFGWMFNDYENINRILKDTSRFPTINILSQFTKTIDSKPIYVRVFKKPMLFLMQRNKLFKLTQEWFLMKDGEEHKYLRHFFSSNAFKKPMVDAITPNIVQHTENLLDNIPTHQSFDLVQALAFPLPMLVITDLLGIPNQDKDKFRAWSSDIASGSLFHSFRELPKFMRASKGMSALANYLENLIEKKRVEKSYHGTSLLDVLLQQQHAHPRITTAQIVSNIILLLLAGHETTAYLISNTLYAYLQHQHEFTECELTEDTINKLIEEGLRFDPPATMIKRVVAYDMDYYGLPLKKGDVIDLCLQNANRDPSIFKNPEQFDIHRENNRQHLSFGTGQHFCIGTLLAKKEAQITLLSFLKKFKTIQLVDKPVHKSSTCFSRFASLNLSVQCVR